MAKLFGTFGVRGVVNKELTPNLAMELAMAFSTWADAKRVVVATDTRTSRYLFRRAVTAGLLATGCTVYDLGIVPIPTFMYHVKTMDVDGGVYISASHCPPDFNALKFVDRRGIGISRERAKEIEEIYTSKRFRRAGFNEVGVLKAVDDPVGRHIKSVFEAVDVEAVRKRRLRVAVDLGGGAAVKAVPRMLRELGVRVYELNSCMDGFFSARKPEPRPETLKTLSKFVKVVKADFGVGYDGDADRAIFTDEEGVVHWGDRTFALATREELRRRGGGLVVTQVATTALIDRVAREYGGTVVRTKVGEPYISEVIYEKGAVLGGEENGGIIWPEISYGRDGVATVAKIAEYVAKSGKTLGELLSELPAFYMCKEGVKCPNELKQKVMEAVKQRILQAGYRVDLTDGVKLLFEDSWLLIRPSGTEPLIRCFSEAEKMEKARELAGMGVKIVKEVLEEVVRRG